MDPISVHLLVALFGVLPCMSYAITSMGQAIIFQIIWQLAYLSGFELASDFVLGIAIIHVGMIPIGILNTYWLWKSVDIRLAALMGIPAALASLIGVEVLLTFDETWLRRGLGVLLLCVYIWLILKRRLEKRITCLSIEDLLTRSGIAQIVCVCTVTGLSRGLFSIGGPPLMLWAALNHISKELCRANISASLVIQQPVTIVYLLYVRKEWRNSDLSYYIVFIAGGIVGLSLGFLIAKLVTQDQFQSLLLYLILMAGAVFISTGLHPMILKLSIAGTCLGLGLLLLGCCIHHEQSLSKEISLGQRISNNML